MDRLNVHRSAIRLLRDERARWFDPELLPAYAPDLNPVEAVWSCAKRADLANFVADDLFDVGDAAGESLARQRRDLRIRRSYFKTAQLPI
jgi:transposase